MKLRFEFTVEEMMDAHHIGIYRMEPYTALKDQMYMVTKTVKKSDTFQDCCELERRKAIFVLGKPDHWAKEEKILLQGANGEVISGKIEPGATIGRGGRAPSEEEKDIESIEINGDSKKTDIGIDDIVSRDGRVYYCGDCAIEYNLGPGSAEGFAAGHCGICHHGSVFVGSQTYENVKKAVQSAKEKK